MASRPNDFPEAGPPMSDAEIAAMFPQGAEGEEEKSSSSSDNPPDVGMSSRPTRLPSLWDKLAECSLPEDWKEPKHVQAVTDILYANLPLFRAGETSATILPEYTSKLTEAAKGWVDLRDKVGSTTSVRPAMITLAEHFLRQITQIEGVTVFGSNPADRVPEFQLLCGTLASWAGEFRVERDACKAKSQLEKERTNRQNYRKDYDLETKLPDYPSVEELIKAMQHRLDDMTQKIETTADRVWELENTPATVSPDKKAEIHRQLWVCSWVGFEGFWAYFLLVLSSLCLLFLVVFYSQRPCVFLTEPITSRHRLHEFILQCDGFRQELRSRDVEVEQLRKQLAETPQGEREEPRRLSGQAMDALTDYDKEIIDLEAMDSPGDNIASVSIRVPGSVTIGEFTMDTIKQQVRECIIPVFERVMGTDLHRHIKEAEQKVIELVLIAQEDNMKLSMTLKAVGSRLQALESAQSTPVEIPAMSPDDLIEIIEHPRAPVTGEKWQATDHVFSLLKRVTDNVQNFPHMCETVETLRQRVISTFEVMFDYLVPRNLKPKRNINLYI
ncbi:hypothetical protein R1sor_018973 [Riccia sorocarpa]|uniref:Uncharacterized protein n=1 Tax=Riccia sorocarpa TaxID=122646 RepID=A0ABD3ICC4_9MARC